MSSRRQRGSGHRWPRSRSPTLGTLAEQPHPPFRRSPSVSPCPPHSPAPESPEDPLASPPQRQCSKPHPLDPPPRRGRARSVCSQRRVREARKGGERTFQGATAPARCGEHPLRAFVQKGETEAGPMCPLWQPGGRSARWGCAVGFCAWAQSCTRRHRWATKMTAVPSACTFLS